jgi:acetyl-CoA C-acetyltransferase
VTEDEAMAKMNPVKLKKLAPFFRKDGKGTVTAGNASPITDGAAAVVLASREAVSKYNLPVLGRILGFADAAQDPKYFPTSPALAITKALEYARVRQEDVDYWEINEAFSVVDLVNQKLLDLDPEKVNVFGGAVAIGHPIGASGCRLIVTLMNVLRVKEGKIGVAAICNGGGGASAMVIEKYE